MGARLRRRTICDGGRENDGGQNATDRCHIRRFRLLKIASTVLDFDTVSAVSGCLSVSGSATQIGYHAVRLIFPSVARAACLSQRKRVAAARATWSDAMVSRENDRIQKIELGV